MPKDYTTLSSEITDPAIKRELQQEADLRKAELALSRLDSELAAGGEALKKMPAIEGELAALRKMLDRPLSVQATLAQPVAEASIKRPDILGSLRTAVTAEFIRRVNRTDPEKTIAELLPDDANRLRRKHARHMLGRKSGIETGSTASPLWGREITQREVLDYWAALEPVSIAGALIARGYAQPLTFGPNVALTIPLRDPANRGSMRPAWGSEGSNIPVVRGGLTSKTFNRHRLGAISVFSQELAKVATPSIAALIQSSILEDMAAAIDAELFGEFDAIAGVRPASLNTGVTPITTTNDPLQDIVALLSAVTVNRPRRPVFIRGTEDAMKLRVHRADGEWIFRTELERSGTVLGVPLIASANLPQSEIICLDGAALMMGLGLPEIDQSSEATVVMLGADGVDPSMAPSGQPDVVTEASSAHVSDASGVTGGPAEVRGMLQTAGEAIRVVQDGLDWAMMDSDLIARVSTAGW